MTRSLRWSSKFLLAVAQTEISNTYSQNSSAGKPSIREPSSSEKIADFALVWETAVCVLHTDEKLAHTCVVQMKMELLRTKTWSLAVHLQMKHLGINQVYSPPPPPPTPSCSYVSNSLRRRDTWT